MFTISATRVDFPRRQSRQHPAILCLIAFFILTGVLTLLQVKPLQAATKAVTWPPLPLIVFEEGFDKPIDVVSANDGTDRLFVVERGGIIYIIENGERVATPFLNIAGRVSDISGNCNECGLLGLAFPPDFAEEGYFFVYYTSAVDLIGPDPSDPDVPDDPDAGDIGDTVIARFHVTGNPNIADSSIEEKILIINQPAKNHNGGHILFGPDGKFYIGMGDGGGTGDPNENAQNPASLHGKILRIEVGETLTYTIPSDNPFIETANYRDEIWMMGLRNPWRYGFDRATGDLFIADVGQGSLEEINYIAAADLGDGGMNFGWPILEGSVCYPPAGSQECDRTGMTPPVFTYGHEDNNCSVTGGHVYDAQSPGQAPIYLYADYCTGRMWGLQRDGENWVSSLLDDKDFRITSFGENADSDIFVVSYAGTIYQVDESVAGLNATNNGPVLVHNPITFSATVTGGTNISYTWDFGDGSHGTGINPSYIYTQSGVYTATVVASNQTNTLTATTTANIADAFVNVTSNQFTPSDAIIPPGGTVIWKLVNGTHSVTADDGSFEQPFGSNWPPFMQTFPLAAAIDAGPIAYHCSLHENLGMTGNVVFQTPVADISAGNDSPTAVESATSFTATVASGDPVLYTWHFGDGESATGANLTHTYAEAGIYTATVIASNDLSAVTTTTTVYIGDAVVEVSSNQFTPNDFTIVSGDTVIWELKEGEHSVTAGDGSFEQPAGTDWPPYLQTFTTVAATNDTAVAYHCSVHVGLGMTGTFTILAGPPAVGGLSAENDGPKQTNEPVGLTATITGGTHITYTWDFGDGNSGSGITTTHPYTPSGIYTATVTATNATNSMSATTTVIVGDAVIDVTSNFFTPRHITVPVGSSVVWVRRDGIHSVTEDDNRFNKTASGDWSTFIQNFESADEYPYHCTVHGFAGGQLMAGTVNVIDQGPPPPAIENLTATNDGPSEVGDPTGFTASVTAGTAISYEWAFGDGSSGSGDTPTHAYAEAGSYTATVVATNATNSMTATTTVIVGDVVVDSNFFTPRHITVPVGSSVVWVRRGGTHSVTEDNNRFDQPASDDWSTFVQSFDSADEYPYHCTIHGFPGGQFMAGTVTVTGSSQDEKLRLPNIRNNPTENSQ